jgi:acylphosphatase
VSSGAQSGKAVHIVVRGRVQGVCFRVATREQGELLGLAGWVRNRSDDRVEAHVQGPAADVDAMVAWCHRGPPSARVDDLVCEAAVVDPALTLFSIRP